MAVSWSLLLAGSPGIPSSSLSSRTISRLVSVAYLHKEEVLDLEGAFFNYCVIREILLTTLLLISDWYWCSPVYPGAPDLSKLRGVALTRKLLRRMVRVQIRDRVTVT